MALPVLRLEVAAIEVPCAQDFASSAVSAVAGDRLRPKEAMPGLGDKRPPHCR